MAQQDPSGRALYERAERVCITVVQSEIDIALGFLRLAEAEACGGNMGHAAELIGKASDIHKVACNYIGDLPTEFEEEKRELQHDVGKLLESIRAAEFPRTLTTAPLTS